MPEPLSPQEIARVRAVQIALRATKFCAQCGQMRLVQQFPWFGAPCCSQCMRALTGAAA